MEEKQTKFMKAAYAAFLLFVCTYTQQANAQGTINIALSQQFSFVGCSTAANVCGTPLIGGLLYFYQVGTVATRQDSFQDTGLSIPNPWPLQLDANGRVPMFYLASGSVHVRLTDAGGVVQFDYPSMLVIGPSGGGGGGAAVDPTTIASTGDIKYRATNEVLAGWVRLNGQTIGNAVSGANGRANADTQALYVYLWQNCPNAHCPVSTGRGASGLADFNAGKQLTLIDLRGRGLVGLDDMGAAAAGRLLASNVTSGGGDTVTTPNATGGEANHMQLVAEMATHNHTLTDPGHSHTIARFNSFLSGPALQFWAYDNTPPGTAPSLATNSATTGITIAPAGSSTPANVMNPFMLGTFYIRL
jgi:microcystin-dependent protein